jgi:hypothetical protein
MLRIKIERNLRREEKKLESFPRISSVFKTWNFYQNSGQKAGWPDEFVKKLPKIYPKPLFLPQTPKPELWEM